jgi:hypothetical protein
MKNTFKLLFSLLMVTLIASCAKEEGTIYDVLDYETGAILRTLSVDNALLNNSIPTSEFRVTIEEQDEQDGALLESVDIYVSLRDLTSDNGTTVAQDKFVKSYDASVFTTSAVGLPQATVSANYGEAFAALGITANDVTAGDIFEMELRLNLTDGRTFGKSSAAGIITGGFFSSPFVYNALIVCSPEPGTYHIDMRDSYGDGWQGGGIEVDIDGDVTKYKVPDEYSAEENPGGLTTIWSAEADVVVPSGTVSLTWTWISDSYNSECEFEIYSPYGDLLLALGYGDFDTPSPGLQAVTFCLLN